MDTPVKALAVAQKVQAGAVDKIREEADAVMASGDVPQMLKYFSSLKDAHQAFDQLKKDLGKTLDYLAKNAIPEAMENQGIKTLTLDDYRFSRSSRMYVSMANKDKALDWLGENGGEDIIQETVNSGTLSSWAKAYIEEQGMDLPDELFKTTIIPNISRTKV